MNVRFRITFILLMLSFVLVNIRLFYWQIIKGGELAALGQSQYGQHIVIAPKRGEIKTDDGFPVVANKIGYLVYANPKLIKDKEETAILLSQMLQVDQATVSAQLDKNRFWVPIKNYVESDVKKQIEDKQIAGVGFEEQALTMYPESSMAAQLLGFVGKDDAGNNKGYFGLEGYYDRQLKGKAGDAVEIQDAFGRPILSKVKNDSGAVDGRSLNLSIDRAIQFMVEQKLKDGIEKFGAKRGMAAIMDPNTGAIIALASFPSFDPVHFADYSGDLYKNPFISDLYEPGSTFKALVMAAAIDAKVVKPDTKCPICAGPVQLGGYDIKTWDNNYFPNTNMIDVIVHSDNTGMVYAAQQLGLDRIISYFTKFGIGDITGIDLQGEVSPNIKPKEQWYPIDLATSGFGQGIDVTPIELLDAFSSLANDGRRMEPHIVSSIDTSDGQKIQIQPKVLDNPVSPATAQAMKEILVQAVNRGEAKFAKIPGYRVAGKTGTAQIPIAGHYDPNKTIASFIGFAPADKPKFTMLVILDRPSSSIYGAETAAPIFFDIAKDLFAYYGIAPTVASELQQK